MTVMEGKPCKNVGEFLSELTPQNEIWAKREEWIFRGQAFDLPLIPKALRDEMIIKKVREYLHKNAGWKNHKMIFSDGEYQSLLQVGAEFDLLRDFAKAADWQGQQLINYDMKFRNENLLYKTRDKFIRRELDYKEWPQDQYLELLALAQHSGLPTRLLDWSERAYIAAYFAAVEAAKSNKGEINIVAWALNTERLQENGCNLKIKVIRPTMGTNPCLTAQRGVLTLLEKYDVIDLEKYLCDTIVDNLESCLKKFVLNGKYGKELLVALYREGIHAGSMFPNLEGAAKFAIERRFWQGHP